MNPKRNPVGWFEIYVDDKLTGKARREARAEAEGLEADAKQARAEAKGGTSWVVLDTDAVMTAVWAEMLHGGQDPYFARLNHIADHYLVPDIDLRWVDDGLRYFGQSDIRRRFMDMATAELDKRRIPYALVRGQGEARVKSAIEALRGLAG